MESGSRYPQLRSTIFTCRARYPCSGPSVKSRRTRCASTGVPAQDVAAEDRPRRLLVHVAIEVLAVAVVNLDQWLAVAHSQTAGGAERGLPAVSVHEAPKGRRRPGDLADLADGVLRHVSPSSLAPPAGVGSPGSGRRRTVRPCPASNTCSPPSAWKPPRRAGTSRSGRMIVPEAVKSTKNGRVVPREMAWQTIGAPCRAPGRRETHRGASGVGFGIGTARTVTSCGTWRSRPSP